MPAGWAERIGGAWQFPGDCP